MKLYNCSSLRKATFKIYYIECRDNARLSISMTTLTLLLFTEFLN